MEQEFITAGRIVGTHGVKGEIKLLPLGIDAAFLTAFPTYYIDGSPVTPSACRAHKGCLLLKLPGVEDMDAALALKGKMVAVRRPMPPAWTVFSSTRSSLASPPGTPQPVKLWARWRRCSSTPPTRSMLCVAGKMST